MSTYPTKDEILAGKQELDPIHLGIVKEWKGTVWKDARMAKTRVRNKAKNDAISSLLQDIATYEKNPVKVDIQNTRTGPHYNPQTKTIVLSKTPSVITGLHELGHHLLGESELQACRYSVWLFRACFPKAYSKLKWVGHTLKRHGSNLPVRRLRRRGPSTRS